MSKEAMGENGAILGSSAYWKHLNESTIFGALMRDTGALNYYDTLHATGERANDAVTEVYEDLQKNLSSIAGVSSDRRSTLAKRLGALYDVCDMSSVTCHRYGDCIGILELSSRYVPSPDREVENALQMLERDFSFTTYEAVSLLKEAVDWGFDRATWRDERKINFLLKLMQGNGTDFLKTVLDAYNIRSGKVDAYGKCGYEIGSSEYLRHLEKQVFLQELPSRLGEDYAKLLREALESIAKQLERDLSVAERTNSYITHETAIALSGFVLEFERCGIRVNSFENNINKLAWYAGGNPAQILELQRRLNRLGLFSRLTEDGVYGEKTQTALEKTVSWIKDHLEEFLLNEDAVALVGFLISFRLDLLSALVAPPSFLWIPRNPVEFGVDLANFLFDNRKTLQRIIWKWGAENYLRPNGCDVAAFMLEHSLETAPSDLHCSQTHWITQKVMQSNGFQRVLYVLERNIQRDPVRYASSGSFGINFQESNDRDLYLSIGNCSLQYTCKKMRASVRIDFSIEDIYDFSEIRTFGVNENGVFFKKNIKKEIGSWANDVGLFSQGDGVIRNYKTFITFSKTIPLTEALQ